MAFGLLWEEDWNRSNVDHMFIADPHIVIAKAFRAVGYQYELVSKTGDEAEEAIWRQKIMDSITQGVPVLAFGVIGPPECCLITGYGNHAEALIWWNFFQDDSAWNQGIEMVEEGYFRKENWFEDTWNVVLVGHLAECRAWAKHFLLHMAENEPKMKEHLTQGSQRYSAIHDLMWNVWAVLGGVESKDTWRSFRDRDARREIAAIIGQAQILDKQAMEHIQLALQQEKHLPDGS